MVTIDTVLLKVASRCNLDCSYCYVYNMGDTGWRDQPKRMPQAVVSAVVANLAELAEAQGRGFSVVLHGGEPLLLGVTALSDLFSRLRRALPSECNIHVQTIPVAFYGASPSRSQIVKAEDAQSSSTTSKEARTGQPHAGFLILFDLIDFRDFQAML